MCRFAFLESEQTTFAAARLIQQSLPLTCAMDEKSPRIGADDRLKAARWLAEKAGEDMGMLARALFRARLPSPVPPPRWWVHHDWKIYRFGGQEIGIGQTELTEIEKSMPSVGALRHELRVSAKASGLFMAFLVMTDIFEERSFLLGHDDRSLGLASHAFKISPDDSGLLALPGVMSRKKQVVPTVAALLKEMTVLQGA